MQSLDPSPVDEEEQPIYPTNPSDINDSKLPSASHTTTNWLGLTPARTLHILSAVQKYSIAPFGIYLTMHYTNTALIPLLTKNVRDADKYLLLTRPYYQSFPLEPLLIFIPVVSHVASGLALRIYRRRINALRHGAETHTQRQTIKWPKLSLTSAAGYILYPMLVLHMLSNRIVPKKIDGSSASVGLRYFAHGISSHPWLGLSSHGFLIATASYHFVSGAAKFLKLSKEYVTEGGEDGRVSRKRRGWAVNGLAALLATVWMTGGLGVIGMSGRGVGWEASHWDQIFKEVPLVGKLF